jgi:hypothetical protein
VPSQPVAQRRDQRARPRPPEHRRFDRGDAVHADAQLAKAATPAFHTQRRVVTKRGRDTRGQEALLGSKPAAVYDDGTHGHRWRASSASGGRT